MRIDSQGLPASAAELPEGLPALLVPVPRSDLGIPTVGGGFSGAPASKQPANGHRRDLTSSSTQRQGVRRLLSGAQLPRRLKTLAVGLHRSVRLGLEASSPHEILSKRFGMSQPLRRTRSEVSPAIGAH